MHGSNDTFASLSLYVNDTLITGRKKALVQQPKKAAKDRFAVKDMGEFNLILGMTTVLPATTTK